ncbi:hypothetical protein V491_06646 [Pseudogymnoascus sp. VKM F-3775]|nr:hypothetical protein V491_06646 [Pseudogymnoascus sp. VKM F-3775]
MSASIFEIGQVVRGCLSKYSITKAIQDGVWLAKNNIEQTVVIKSVRNHPRVENERDVTKRFQNRTSYLRSLVDEIEGPLEPEPVTIVLKHLHDNLLNASVKKDLSRREIKYVSRRVLEALRVLHEDGYVHIDVKLSNVFINYKEGDVRFSSVQLGDLGGTIPADSKHAKGGVPVGASMWSSPEVIMETSWNTATDIWSFGTMVRLIYGLIGDLRRDS